MTDDSRQVNIELEEKTIRAAKAAAALKGQSMRSWVSALIRKATKKMAQADV